MLKLRAVSTAISMLVIDQHLELFQQHLGAVINIIVVETTFEKRPLKLLYQAIQSIQKIDRLYRFWCRMMKTKCAGDKFEMVTES